MGPHMIWSQRKGQKQSARLCRLEQGNPRRNCQEMNEKATYSHWRHISGLSVLIYVPKAHPRLFGHQDHSPFPGRPRCWGGKKRRAVALVKYLLGQALCCVWCCIQFLSQLYKAGFVTFPSLFTPTSSCLAQYLAHTHNSTVWNRWINLSPTLPAREK